MKKLLLLLAFTAVNPAWCFKIINKTNSPLKVSFNYTSGVCRADSRILAPQSHSEDINIGLCLLSEIGAITQSSLDIRAAKLTGLMRANDTTVEIGLHATDRDRLVMSIFDGRGNLVQRTAETGMRVPDATRVGSFAATMPY